MSPATEMNRFLMDVENRAFRMAELAVGNRDDAMDIVQDTMLTLARKYAKRPTTEWRPLFFRILQNRITDCYRRRASSNRLFSFFSSFRNDEGEVAALPRRPPR
ncbi:MAG: sigma factor, partial [Pseudomonadota bacterium]